MIPFHCRISVRHATVKAENDSLEPRGLPDPLFTGFSEATSAATARAVVVAMNSLQMAGGANLFDDQKDLSARMRGVLNAARPVRVLNNAIRWRDAGGGIHENAVGSQLRGVTGVRTRSGGIAGFEFHRHQPLSCLNQVVRFAGEPVAKRYERAVQPA